MDHHDPVVTGDLNETVEKVRQTLAALAVPPLAPGKVSYGADPAVVAEHSQGFSRAEQTLAAVRSPSTRHEEYEQSVGEDSLRLLVAVHPVRTKQARFVLVVLGFGLDDQKRELVAGFRLYPADHAEESKLLDEPGFAIATLIARYGAEYEVERGERSLFKPLVDFERQRFVRPNEVQPSEVTEALGFDYNPEALVGLHFLRLKVGGGVWIVFPIILRTDAYRADVEAASS
jgi:hypothetical protein